MKEFQYYIIITLQKIGHCLFFVLYKIFTRLEIIGRENLQSLNGPVILASNHTGELDVTALCMVLPFFSPLNPIYFTMNTREKFRIGKNFGWRSGIYSSGFLNLLGGCSICSGNKDYATALDNQVRLLKKGRTVCIFPEGKCTRDGQYCPAHGGLGYLIYISGATTVPIAINTFFKMSWKEFLTGHRKVVIKIGEPIRAGELILQEMDDPGVEDFRHISQKILDKSKEMMV